MSGDIWLPFRSLLKLRDEDRRRLLGDHAAENAAREPDPGGVYGMETPEGMHGLARPCVTELTDRRYIQAIANLVESGIEVLVEDELQRFEALAEGCQDIRDEMEAQYTRGEQATILHKTNPLREVAQGPLYHRYECSGLSYVDECEVLYRECPEEIMELVDADYRHALVARRVRGKETRTEQIEKLETIFKGKVVSGKVRTVEPSLAEGWGKSHLARLREMNFKQLV
jgi:hypothetical protein